MAAAGRARRAWACGLGLVAALLLMLAAPARGQPAWQQRLLPGATPGIPVPVLKRDARDPPAALRVVVVVGSGCAGMGPIASAYFEGLPEAQIWVLHKPFTRPWVRTAPDDCSAAFVRHDRHSRWQADVLSAWRALSEGAPERPTWLVGISEGADVLPALAHAVGPSLQGLVLLAASGLDPAQTLRLQAQRIGRLDAWDAIVAAARGPGADDDIVHGRSLGHWRDLLGWRLFDPLTETPWTVWHWWGDADEHIPPEAHETFAREARARPAHVCSRRWPQGDHGLYAPGAGQAQPLLWRLLMQHRTLDARSCPE